jgi:hypothetical protein
MTKQHLDLFALAPGAPVSRGLCYFPGHIACRLINAPCHFAPGCVGTALFLEPTGFTVESIGMIVNRVGFGNAASRLFELAIHEINFLLSHVTPLFLRVFQQNRPMAELHVI